MKRILPGMIGYLLVILFISCSKSSGTGDGEPPTPPDPGSTGEIKATLNFSTGNALVLNATGNSTFFNRLIDTRYHDTILTFTGSFNGSLANLTIRLTNINATGTYPFITNQTAPPSEGYPQCEYNGNSSGEFYSTQQIKTNPGSITIQTFTSDYISGYFNAELTNWYPGRTDTGTTITVSNGSFKGNFKTSSY